MGVVWAYFIGLIAVILTGLCLLISGYKGLEKNEKESEEFFYSKRKIGFGITILTLLGIVLIVGLSRCFSIKIM